MTELQSEVIFSGFGAMAAAVVWLARKWEVGNNRCEERGNALQGELRDLRDWVQTTLVKTLQESAGAMDRNTQAFNKLKREVRETLDPTEDNPDSDTESDLHKSLTGYERQVLERHNNGETTAIIRRVK